MTSQTHITTQHRAMTEAMLRLVCLYRRRRLAVSLWDRTGIDPAEIGRVFYGERERVMECRRLGIGVFHAIHTPAHVAGATAFLLGDHGIGVEPINRFMTGLCGGSLPYGDPRLSLRRIMRAYAAQREAHPDYEALAYMLRTWNLYVGRKVVSAVAWKPDDGMPRIGKASR